MTITEGVHQQFFVSTSPLSKHPKLIRLPPTIVVRYNIEDRAASTSTATTTAPPHQCKPSRRKNLWSVEEHNRFLLGLEIYPKGPWKSIASVIGTKNTRQAMTHAQKYRQKIARNRKNDERLFIETSVPGDQRSVPSSEVLPRVPVLERPRGHWL